jgi:ABC-type antimicrobial peptide transport system permease subunit
MILSYLRIAFRNLVKNKFISFINIGGLAVGMAVAILIGLWIVDELSFNKYHKNYDQLAQVMQHQTFNGEIQTGKAIPFPLAAELRQSFGNDFKFVALSSWTNPHVLGFGDKKISQPGNYMEADAPEMLSLKMVSGTRMGLQNPSSILLSQSVSVALFGGQDPIGKAIKFDAVDLMVTGVYEDLPHNSSLRNITFIAPWNLFSSTDEDVKNAMDNWNNNSFQLFVQVADKSDMSQVSARIRDTKLNKTGDDLKPEIFLQPMSRWNLYSEFKDGVNTGGKIEYVWLFGIIGAFVLMLACINFMNLSTARSEKRSREVGVRKSLGSARLQLISQFFSESILASFIAFVFSLLLIQLFLPLFNEIAGKHMDVLWTNSLFWLFGIGFTLMTGLFAGSYPAFYLSSFLPAKVLKGSFSVGRSGAIPRKVLVVIQFTVSVVMIIGTLVVFRQIEFAKNRPVGYDRERLIVIRPYSSEFHDHFASMRNELLKTGLIAEVGEGNSVLTGSRTAGGLEWKGKDPMISDEFMTFGVSYEYGKTLKWRLTMGRDFSEDFQSDSSGLILNEAAVKYMGLKAPIGETITWGKRYTVIGVTQNIVMGSPYDFSKPTIFYISDEPNFVNIRVHANANIADALQEIETICKQFAPMYPFEFKFADDEYARKFGEEERIGKLAGSFAGLAIFISCLGLFGIASFMAEQRTKEIGIRKILGASVLNLWGFLSKEFVVLVLISLMVAVPASYVVMSRWLQNFTYHTDIPALTITSACIGAIITTLLTVSFQILKTAISNPVKSLRSE